jgi:Dynein heavy chain C-terminal domain/Dynein heavy chain AAA lid domain/ATP-binding dynein motor region
MQRVQAAVEHGWAVIIEHLDFDDSTATAVTANSSHYCLDPMLLPLVSRALYTPSSAQQQQQQQQQASTEPAQQQYVSVGSSGGLHDATSATESSHSSDAPLPLRSSFRLYLHTAATPAAVSSSQRFAASGLQGRVTCVNFAVTAGALEEQLLSAVLRIERPDLAIHTAALWQQKHRCAVKLAALEASVLERLASSSGSSSTDVDTAAAASSGNNSSSSSSSEDRGLIEAVEHSKDAAVKAKQELERTTTAVAVIAQLNEQYRPLAARAALLFTARTQLALISPLYSCSLSSFVAQFQTALDAATGALADDAALAGGASLISTVPGRRNRLRRSVQEARTARAFSWSDSCIAATSEDDVRASKASLPALVQQAADTAAVGHMSEAAAAELLLLQHRVGLLNGRVTTALCTQLARGLAGSHKLGALAVIAARVVQSSSGSSSSASEAVLYAALVGSSTASQQQQRHVNEALAALSEEARKLLPEHTWRELLMLETLSAAEPLFTNLAQHYAAHAEQWSVWRSAAVPEDRQPPNTAAASDDSTAVAARETAAVWGKQVSIALLIRALRPDRLAHSLQRIVSAVLGADVVAAMCTATLHTSLRAVHRSSSSSSPIVLLSHNSAQWSDALHELAADAGATVPEVGAASAATATIIELLQAAGQKGSWVILHGASPLLLDQLLPLLHTLATTALPEFRCILVDSCNSNNSSSSSSSSSSSITGPTALLQHCTVLAHANPATTDLRSSLQRAWSQFKQSDVDSNTAKPTEYRACLFGLCVAHVLLSSRAKYSSWRCPHATFTDCDLAAGAAVLQSLLSSSSTIATAAAAVPWSELRYLTTATAYGGSVSHLQDIEIVRATVRTVLSEALMSGSKLAPGLRALKPKGMDYAQYTGHIDKMPFEDSAVVFGLSASSADTAVAAVTASSTAGSLLNVIAHMSSSNSSALSTVLQLTGGFTTAEQISNELLASVPQSLDIADCHITAAAQGDPYAAVLLQECASMNALLQRMRSSLNDVIKALRGQLIMNSALQQLAQALAHNTVPCSSNKSTSNSSNSSSSSYCNWVEWPTGGQRLRAWLTDMTARVAQLRRWALSVTARTPACVWISGFFSPARLLLAVRQAAARAQRVPLERCVVRAQVTCLQSADEAAIVVAQSSTSSSSKDSSSSAGVLLVHGLQLVGARWGADRKEDADSSTARKRLKALQDKAAKNPAVILQLAAGDNLVLTSEPTAARPFPVVQLQAVVVPEDGTSGSSTNSSSNGSVAAASYECPVYETAQQQQSSVFSVQLPSASTDSLFSEKCTLAGVMLVMLKAD